MDSPGVALVSSRRDLDAPRRASENPNPKTRMLGPTPMVFLKVDVSRKRINMPLATPEIFVYRVGAKDDK